MERSTWDIDSNAASVHADALVWDNHTCMPLRTDDSFLPQLQRFRASGVDVVSVNVFFDGMLTWTEGLKVLAFMRNWILSHPEDYVLVATTDDITEARASGKLAVFFDVEGMEALDGDVNLVRIYYELGVRWMLVAYNRNNRAGGGCLDDDIGLTDFGKEVILAAEDVGLLICCSHTGAKTCMDVFERSKNPVLLSHSNPKALLDHPRNVSDDIMTACAATGGIVGITGYGLFLIDGEATPDNLLRHIDYAVNLVGAEHVGLGMDYVFDVEELKAFFTNKTLFPFGGVISEMMPPETMPLVTEAMLKFGYPESAVRGILGENLFRVAKQVWK